MCPVSVEAATGGDPFAYVQRGETTLVAVFSALSLGLVGAAGVAASDGRPGRSVGLLLTGLLVAGVALVLWRRRADVTLAVGPLGVYLADIPTQAEVVRWGDVAEVEVFRRLSRGRGTRSRTHVGVTLTERADTERATTALGHGPTSALERAPDPVIRWVTDEVSAFVEAGGGRGRGPSVQVDPLTFRRRALEDAVRRYAPTVPFRSGRTQGAGPGLTSGDLRRVRRTAPASGRQDPPPRAD